jgi:hypothetical protein
VPVWGAKLRSGMPSYLTILSDFTGQLTNNVLVLVVLLFGAVVVLSIALVWVQGRAGRRVRSHKQLGVLGEQRAVQILKQAGYEIVSHQTQERYAITVNGQTLQVYLRADFLVRKAGQLFVAEAKSGTESAKVSTRATRRQLLEYLYAFRVSGVLLVDVTASRVFRVEFPVRRS